MNPPITIWQRMVRASGTREINQTLAYYASFVGIGMTTASLGPTLLGLAAQTRSDISQLGFLFIARALGYLMGSLIGGRLLDRLPGHRTMAGAILLTALLLALVPTIPLLWLLTIVLLAVGVSEGITDVGGNTLIVWVHHEKVGPFMNGLHLFFAIGALLSPLLIASVVYLTGTFGAGYWLLALLLLPVALRFVSLPNPTPLVSRQDVVSVTPHLVLLLLVVAFFLLDAGGEQAFGGWIYTYAVKAGLANETTAALVNAAYWGAFTVSRVVAIPIALRVRSRFIILADLILAVGGLIALFAFSASPLALWLGTILFGFGIASAFPTMITFAGRHMTITGTITGWFFVGASLGGMILPALISQAFEPVGPTSVLLIIGVALVMALGVFGLILGYVNREQKV